MMKLYFTLILASIVVGFWVGLHAAFFLLSLTIFIFWIRNITVPRLFRAPLFWRYNYGNKILLIAILFGVMGFILAGYGLSVLLFAGIILSAVIIIIILIIGIIYLKFFRDAPTTGLIKSNLNAYRRLKQNGYPKDKALGEMIETRYPFNSQRVRELKNEFIKKSTMETVRERLRKIIKKMHIIESVETSISPLIQELDEEFEKIYNDYSEKYPDIFKK